MSQCKTEVILRHGGKETVLLSADYDVGEAEDHVRTSFAIVAFKVLYQHLLKSPWGEGMLW